MQENYGLPAVHQLTTTVPTIAATRSPDAEPLLSPTTTWNLRGGVRCGTRVGGGGTGNGCFPAYCALPDSVGPGGHPFMIRSAPVLCRLRRRQLFIVVFIEQ